MLFSKAIRKVDPAARRDFSFFLREYIFGFSQLSETRFSTEFLHDYALFASFAAMFLPQWFEIETQRKHDSFAIYVYYNTQKGSEHSLAD